MSDDAGPTDTLAGLYLDEALGRVEAIVATLTVRDVPDDDDIAWALLAAHSLKGLTAQAGDESVASDVHRIEDDIEALKSVEQANRPAGARAIVESLRATGATLSSRLSATVTRDVDLTELATAAEREITRVADRRGIAVTLDLTVPPGIRISRRLAGVLVDALGHVIRNAVAHGTRHGGAVRIAFSVTEDALSIVVGDRGNTASRSAEPSLDAGRGVGVQAAQMRLQAVGGDLTLSPAPWGGTSATLTVPRTTSRR